MTPLPPVSPFTLHHGDCLDVLSTLPADSFDCSVEDPPAGIGFMGKPWDSYKSFKPRTDRGVEVQAALKALGFAAWEHGFVSFMVEVHIAKMRVLKPGAFVLTWALPKTADLAGLALRLAGFELHDSIVHLFGQGMSKAGDLGKKIDKAAGAEREVIGVSPTCTGPSQRDGMLTKGVSGEPVMLTVPATPEAERWTGWSSQLAPGHEQWLLARKPSRLTYAEQVLTHGCGALNVGARRVPRGEEEHAAKVEWHAKYGERDYAHGSTLGFNDGTAHRRISAPDPGGSLPKNVILTPGGEACPVAEIDRQGQVSGVHSAGSRQEPSGLKPTSGGIVTQVGPSFDHGKPRRHGDDGGASRFFTRFGYFPKASDREVPGGDAKGNRHPTHKHPELMRWLVGLVCPKGGFLVREHAELRQECDLLQAEYEKLRAEYETLRRPFAVTADVPYTDVWTFPTVAHYPGKHPCEKPAALLDHVITASSRPGDVVFDGFMGSGATGERAALLGRRFIGCELGDYFDGATQRVLAAAQHGQPFTPPKRGRKEKASE